MHKAAMSLKAQKNGVSVETQNLKVTVEFYAPEIVRVVKQPTRAGQLEKESFSVIMTPDKKMQTSRNEDGHRGLCHDFRQRRLHGLPRGSHQAVFYAAMLSVVNTFAVFTVGTMMVTGSEGTTQERFNKKVLYSTPMLSAYLSMLIVALGIGGIPEFVNQPLIMIGNITVPATLLSMVSIPLLVSFIQSVG